MNEPQPMLFWEWAAWTLTCILALVAVSVAVQHLNDASRDSYTVNPPAASTPCGRYGCYRR